MQSPTVTDPGAAVSGLHFSERYFWEPSPDPVGEAAVPSKGHHLHDLFSKLSTHETTHAPSAPDPKDLNTALSPHLHDVAHLRRNNSLSDPELRFLDARRTKIADSGSLAKFLQLPPGTVIDERDVPTLGLGGSGGGMRANLGFISTIATFQEIGQWDNVSYVAGVSGSCWAIASMYTLPLSPPVTAPLSALPLLDHFKDVAGTHPLSAAGMRKVADAAGGTEALLGPLKSKHQAGESVCFIDLYSTLTTSYFWLVGGKQGKPRVEAESLLWTRAFDNGNLDSGMEPFPILTAVRHERPWHDWKSPETPFEDMETPGSLDNNVGTAWWQWFEFNPVESGCDELEGWIPTWAFGRHFDKGVSTQFLPEHSLSLILGMATAAPAAPLSSFLGTIWRNLPQNIVGTWLRRVTKSAAKHIGDSEMDIIDNVNPVHAGNEPNPFFGAPKQPLRGNNFENSPRLHLVDSGMANNCPTHVFLHPARDVDLVFLFDASSDVQKGGALARINEYGATKGLVFTPRSPLAPLSPTPAVVPGAKPPTLTPDEMRSRFDDRYAQLLDGKAHRAAIPGKEGVVYNVHHQSQAWRDVLLVYIPLFPNAVNPDYDPSTAAFSSSYNLVWTPEQIDTIHKTASANVHDGISVIRAAVKEVYECRRKARLRGDTNLVDIARRNVAEGREAVQSLVIVGPKEVEPTDGTRPWME